MFTGWAGVHVGTHQHVPVVLEVRDLWPDYFSEMGVLTNSLALRLLLRLERSLYARAAAIVTVAEGARKWLIERKAVPPAKVHCIPNGVDRDRFAPAPPAAAAVRRQHGCDGKFVVGYIGNHGLGQGLESVVETARLLNGEPDIHFLFVGHGAEKSRITALATEVGLTNVTFLPPCPREEVARYYQAADVCLVPLADVPAFRNTIPSKLFEILGSARAVIGALRGDGADLIIRSRAGVVVPPAQPADLADAICRLRAMPLTERQELGDRGRRFVEEHYDRRVLADRYLELLATVAGDTRGLGHRK